MAVGIVVVTIVVVVVIVVIVVGRGRGRHDDDAARDHDVDVCDENDDRDDGASQSSLRSSRRRDARILPRNIAAPDEWSLGGVRSGAGRPGGTKMHVD